MTAIDRVDRRDLHGRFGVDEPVWAMVDSWAGSLEETDRVDIVVEAIGHQLGTLTEAVNALAMEGQLYYFGIPDDEIYPFPMAAFLRRNGRLVSGFTRERERPLARAMSYLADHPDLLTGYVTHEYAFDEVESAFTRACRPAPGQLKVVLVA